MGVTPGSRNAVTLTFTRIVALVHCVTCWAEMPAETWPSHYRTASHRRELQRTRVGLTKSGQTQRAPSAAEWFEKRRLR